MISLHSLAHGNTRILGHLDQSQPTRVAGHEGWCELIPGAGHAPVADLRPRKAAQGISGQCGCQSGGSMFQGRIAAAFSNLNAKITLST